MGLFKERRTVDHEPLFTDEIMFLIMHPHDLTYGRMNSGLVWDIFTALRHDDTGGPQSEFGDVKDLVTGFIRTYVLRGAAEHRPGSDPLQFQGCFYPGKADSRHVLTPDNISKVLSAVELSINGHFRSHARAALTAIACIQGWTL